jgi:hypothetical protein
MKAVKKVQILEDILEGDTNCNQSSVSKKNRDYCTLNANIRETLEHEKMAQFFPYICTCVLTFCF